MATAVFPGAPQAPRPVLIPQRKSKPLPSLSAGRAVTSVGDLTIHRITDTHHGRTLLTLGHAAEYLANSHRYSTPKTDRDAEVEAIHLLMTASRAVFEEYAARPSVRRRLEDWVVERTVRVVETVAAYVL
jgi:hypothetical protein